MLPDSCVTLHCQNISSCNTDYNEPIVGFILLLGMTWCGLLGWFTWLTHFWGMWPSHNDVCLGGKAHWCYTAISVAAQDGSYSNIYIYICYPLYTNWPITNADLPHVIIQYIPYFIYQKLYWTVSGQLSNIGYIGQFQNEATGTLRTRFRRTKAVSMHLMKILSIFLHLRKTLICFHIGWFL